MLTTKQLNAIEYIVNTNLTDSEIEAELNLSSGKLTTWRANNEFSAKLTARKSTVGGRSIGTGNINSNTYTFIDEIDYTLVINPFNTHAFFDTGSESVYSRSQDSTPDGFVYPANATTQQCFIPLSGLKPGHTLKSITLRIRSDSANQAMRFKVYRRNALSDTVTSLTSIIGTTISTSGTNFESGDIDHTILEDNMYYIELYASAAVYRWRFSGGLIYCSGRSLVLGSS